MVPISKSLVRGLFATLLIGAAFTAVAEPYVPDHPDEVLLQLPPSRLGRADGRLASLVVQHQVNPGDPDVAAALATLHMERGRQLDDPRLFGNAEATLATFPENAPPVVRRTRASLRSYLHQFAAALADYDAVLAATPDDVESRLARSQLLLLLGRPDTAAQDCAELAGRQPAFAQATCNASVEVQRGLCREADRHLTDLLARPDLSLDVRAWVLELAAGTAAASGDLATAESLLREALALTGEQARRRVALADVLLAAKKPTAVLELIAADTLNLSLLVRRLAAAQRAGADTTAMLARADDLFQSEAQRGNGHDREKALYLLKVRNDAAAAVAVARANWQMQKEPVDALILTATEIAAKEAPSLTQAVACAPPLDW